MSSSPTSTVRGRRRAALGLACGIVAMLAVVVLPPAAWLAGGAAIVLGADADHRARRAEGRRDRMASAALVLGALSIAVGIALVLAALGGG